MIYPDKVKEEAKKKADENYRFRTYLKGHADELELDMQFLRLHKELFDGYDCSKCRNCCKMYKGSIPEEDIQRDAEYLGITLAEVYGVITFYSRFTLKPKGKYNIAVCLGTACYVKGSEKILERVKERLKINPGETTPDGKFSIEETRCIGACGLAPVFTINGEVYGKATVQKVDQVLDEYMKFEK